MTGSQGVTLLAAAPTVAVLVALVARARAGVVVTSALVGELAAYAVVFALTRYALRRGALTEGTIYATADVGLTNRLTALFALAVFALLVAGVGIGLRYVATLFRP